MRKFLSGIKSLISRAGRAVGSFFASVARYLFAHPFFEWIALSLILYFITDSLCRRSITESFIFVFTSPVMFFFNFAIVAVGMSVSLLFRHRYFFYLLNLIFWLTLSITDFVLLGMRADPFSAVDLNVIVTALGIVPKYIGWGGIIAIIAAFAASAALLVLLWRRHPKIVRMNRSAAALRSAAIALVICVFSISTSYYHYIPDNFENAAEAYDTYGFPYCFFRSFVRRGVTTPDEYSEDAIADLMEKLGDAKNNEGDVPNVIFLQLESFFDVNRVRGLTLSENPIPNFTSLKERGASGKLSVNTIGGGTANTEFEVLCGMNLTHFGLLECPYTTVLNRTPCRSAASVFAECGLTTHAIHNHIATFYDRNVVYSNLGFDTFTPVEYMKNVDRNILGWAKDTCLKDEILSALSSTEGHDFIFTVSVQPHGKYPSFETVGDDDIHVITYPDEKMIFAIEYYVNEISGTDAFLGDMISALRDYPENVVVVAYGDHLPILGLDDESMFSGDLYSTEYVIWTNYDSCFEGGDIQAFQLAAKVMDGLGIDGGGMFSIHRKLSGDPNYDSYMKLMEYDSLEGEHFATHGRVPVASAMSYGTEPIAVTGAKQYGDILFVAGENFTENSFVFVNGRRHDTTIVSDTLLVVKDAKLREGDEIYTAQLCEGGTLLSHSPTFTYSPSDEGAGVIPDGMFTESAGEYPTADSGENLQN